MHATAASAAEPVEPMAPTNAATAGWEPVQVVVEHAVGHRHEDRLEDEGPTDGDQDPGHLVLHQDSEAQPEEAEEDRSTTSPGTTAPAWSVT